MGAAVGAAERLIATVTKQMAILKIAWALAGGGLEWANRPEYASHKQRAKTQNSIAECGLTNKLHRVGRNP